MEFLAGACFTYVTISSSYLYLSPLTALSKRNKTSQPSATMHTTLCATDAKTAEEGHG